MKLICKQTLKHLSCFFFFVYLIKYNSMKKAFSFLVIITISLTAFCQTWARLEEAHKYVGNTVNVLGFVSNIRSIKNAECYTTFIALDGKDRAHTLTLTMRSFKRPDLTALKKAYLNEYVQVKGKVEIRGGKSQIRLFSERQISAARQSDNYERYEPY